MEYQQIASLVERIKQNIQKVIIGKEKEIELVLSALICGGHVLLEDVPGTGKTTLAKALAKSMNGGFARVQFTPDLLPADVTGTRVFRQQTGDFVFMRGPVFTNILLADEINRATPRTQSALLECMEERQVSEGGVTYALEAPFLVIATQNPVETQGTFPLPEAQLDRFLIRISLGYPTANEALAMMQRFRAASPLAVLDAVADMSELAEAGKLYARCEVSEPVMNYIAALCEAARDPGKVRLGPSPRAMLNLMRACQALAAVRGRDYVIPDDVKEMAVPVLAHRVIMRGMHAQNAEAFVRELLNQLPAPTEEAL
ncbi:MAG: MoxR family ATPase [Clostridia bacterium]|nr:MoxR family ATPase [Clostridia bacterium]